MAYLCPDYDSNFDYCWWWTPWWMWSLLYRLSVAVCQCVQHAFAYVSIDRFLAYTIYHNTDRCAFSNVSIPCAWECARAATVRRRSIYSMSCICMVCRFDDNVNATADWTIGKMLLCIRDACICTACHRYGCVYVAGGATIG